MPRPNRRAMRAQKKEKRTSINPLKFLVPVAAIFLLFFFLKVTTKYWNGNDKIALVYKESGGNVNVSVLDPKLMDFTTLIIPGDSQVEVAENYGTFRIKNVWQLGVNEKKTGRLLSETVARNFTFPVNLWSDSDAVSLKNGNFGGIVKFMFLPKNTNMPFGDRVHVGLFSLRIKSSNKNEIDLAKSQFLNKQKLSDGQIGYILEGKISEHLSVYFSDNEIAESSVRVSIIDGSGKYGIAQKIGEILEVMGGKVVSIDKNSDLPEVDCVVSGKDVKIVKKITRLFSCISKDSESAVDLQITLGGKFAKRF